jgi:outer membrane protein OmpA-like peptidoglycan-associated protein
MMRFSLCVFLAGLLAAGTASVPVSAAVQTGNEISVNPLATGNGTLLYPGGQYMRVVHPLLQPGEKPGPVQLHMPGQRSARTSAARTPRSSPVRTAVAAPPPQEREPVRPATKAAVAKPAPEKRVAVAPPQPARSPAFGAGPQGAAGLNNLSTLPSAPQTQIAKAVPPQSMVAPPAAAGLTKRSVILFAAGAADPAQSALGAIKFLAGDLNTAMTGAGSRVQILAYGGDKGDKGSDARRLSLKRALAIRQVLIDDGVAAERIDVRAMGGADDGGPTDRVDVYIKT